MSTLSLSESVCWQKMTLPFSSLPAGEKQSLAGGRGGKEMAPGERCAAGGDGRGGSLDVCRLSMVHRANKSGKWKIRHRWSEK